MANSLEKKTAPFYPPPMPPAFIVRAADWNLDETAIALVRRAVFIVEQGVPEALEWEPSDAQCRWFMAVSPVQAVIGIARLTKDGRVGRMAVRSEWRKRGVGRSLLECVLQAAGDLGLSEVHLSAQIHAMPFYARFGFVAEGPEYLDAGIPHRTMRLNLRNSA
jgi:predicted GNAT family N-acyltransferase